MKARVSPLDQLLNQGAIWRAGRSPGETAQPCVPSGYQALDRLLVGEGWHPGSLIELLYQQPGGGELRLLLPLLARLSRKPGWILWVDPPHIPYAPALAAAGLNLERVLLVSTPSLQERLWTLEQGLKSGCCGAVLGWLPAGEERALRRLQLAAAEGGGLGFLYRPLECRQHHSSAAYRLLLKPRRHGVELTLLKRRQGWPLPPRDLSLDESQQAGAEGRGSASPSLQLVN